MLSVILKILSILGIILLVLLGVILIVLLLVLFFPICYRIKADRRPVTAKADTGQNDFEAPQWAMHAEAKAWWLFGLLRAGYKYPEPGVLKVKLLFFTLYNSGKTALSDETDKSVESDYTENPTASKHSDHKEEADSPNIGNAGNVDNEADSAGSKNQEPNVASEEQENLSIIEKIQYTIQKFCDKIKSIFEKIKDIRENAAYYKEVLTSEEAKGLMKHASMRLGKILKSIRPRKLRADIRFGAASPDITGYVCAAYGMICSHLGKHVIFTPDFEQEILEGNVYAAGHITVFKILWNGFKIATDRRLWLLKDKLTDKQV